MAKVARKRNSSFASAIELTCDATVEERDLVYIDSDEVLKKADASDPSKMPAIGYVVKKKGSTKAFIVKTTLEIDEDEETLAKKIYFVSTTRPGKLEDVEPTEPNHVRQKVGVGITSGKKLIDIDSIAIVRT